MGILVAYATKYGMTKAYAEIMAKQLGAEAKLLDLASSEALNIDLKPFGLVLLGSAVYAGQARPALGRFLKRRGTELKDKKTAFFLCGMASGGEGQGALEAAFPAEIRSRASAVSYLPGWVYMEKVKSFERFVINMISKARAKSGTPAPERPDLEAEAAAFLKGIRGGAR
jgi:menaquinone-dependent protoporphyrinogen IX oxidase